MAKNKPVSAVVSLVAWLTGVLVSLAVGFGMVGGVLTIPKIPLIVTVVAGWIVVILTVISVILAIADRL
jgi:hypothetical protein